MKRFLSILFLFVILFQSLSQLFILGNFYLNRNYIAETKCENRFDKIKLCKGHCYLTKELKESEKKTEKFPDVKQKELKFTEQAVEILSFYFSEDGETTFSSDCRFYISLGPDSVFHPPKV